MAKSKSSGADARPSDEEISQRAYELFLQRGSAPGHENDDWLQAEAELMAARRDAQAAFAPAADDQSDGAESGSAASSDDNVADGKKPNGRREGSGSGRRTLRQ